jgi:hypothetical protein
MFYILGRMVVWQNSIGFPINSQLCYWRCTNFNCLYLRFILLEMQTTKKITAELVALIFFLKGIFTLKLDTTRQIKLNGQGEG